MLAAILLTTSVVFVPVQGPPVTTSRAAVSMMAGRGKVRKSFAFLENFSILDSFAGCLDQTRGGVEFTDARS